MSGYTDTLTEASNLVDELYRLGEIENKQQYRIALNKVSTIKKELPSKLFKRIASNTRPKIEEPNLNVMDKATYEEHLVQPIHTNTEPFKIAITFLTGYNGIFKLTDKNIKFRFAKSISDDDDFIQITLPPGAYEIETLNKGLKRNIDKEYFTEEIYPLKIKPNFSTLGFMIKTSEEGPLISFLLDDSIRNLSGFNASTIYGEYNSSPNTVDISSFDNILLGCDIAQGMIYEGRRSGTIHNWTMTLDPGYKYVETFTGGITWYMMESKDIILSISFRSKKENGNLVSFNGHSVTFRLSIKEI